MWQLWILIWNSELYYWATSCFFLCHGWHPDRFLTYTSALCLFSEMSHSIFHSCFSNYSKLPNPLSPFDLRWHLNFSQLLKSGVVPHILGWHLCKQLLPVPQFVMVVAFVHADLLHQTWHLNVIVSTLFPQFAQWNLIRCANSKPFTSM